MGFADTYSELERFAKVPEAGVTMRDGREYLRQVVDLPQHGEVKLLHSEF